LASGVTVRVLTSPQLVKVTDDGDTAASRIDTAVVESPMRLPAARTLRDRAMMGS
jgi:hypothetical protein